MYAIALCTAVFQLDYTRLDGLYYSSYPWRDTRLLRQSEYYWNASLGDDCTSACALSPIVQVCETPDIYERVVLPYVQSIPSERLQWVYNVLEKKVRRREGGPLKHDVVGDCGVCVVPEL